MVHQTPEDPKRLLLVEDESLVALTETKLLRDAGYQVHHRRSGESAVAFFEDNEDHADLVLMDIDLGEGIDGIEAAQRILSARDLPLLFLSSHTEQEIVERAEQVSSYGYVVKNSGDVVLLASIRMAFRLSDAHRGLNRWQNLMQEVVQHNPSAVAVLDKELVFRYVSERFLLDYGVSRAQVIGRHHDEVFADIPEKWRQVHQRVLAGEVLGADEEPFTRTDGTAEYSRWECRPWHEPDGSIGGTVLYTEIVTRAKQAELELRTNNLLLRSIINSSADAIFVKDAQHRVVLGNEAFARTMPNPMTVEEIIGKTDTECGWSEKFVKGDPETGSMGFEEADRRALAGETVEITEEPGAVGNKEGLFQTIKTPFRNAHGDIIGIVCISRDVTAYKTLELEMRKALEEKATLLREVQHRVKNNLNVVSSLLSLEIPKLSDPHSQQVFMDAASRVRSMGKIYESLQHSDSPNSTRANEFLEDLIPSIVTAYSIGAADIDLRVELADIELETGDAVALGLIVNEAVTNSLKYAFPPGSPNATLSISIRAVREDLAVLRIKDNGAGLPEDFDLDTAGGTGSVLMKALAEQLGGSIMVGPAVGGGTLVSLTFDIRSGGDPELSNQDSIFDLQFNWNVR